jgi:hypothetical protein
MLKRLIDRADKHYGRLSRTQPTADQVAKWQLQQKLPSLLAEIMDCMTEHSSGCSDSANANSTSSSTIKTGKMPVYNYVTYLLVVLVAYAYCSDLVNTVMRSTKDTSMAQCQALRLE